MFCIHVKQPLSASDKAIVVNKHYYYYYYYKKTSRVLMGPAECTRPKINKPYDDDDDDDDDGGDNDGDNEI